MHRQKLPTNKLSLRLDDVLAHRYLYLDDFRQRSFDINNPLSTADQAIFF
jgi:hypothetical protein